MAFTAEDIWDAVSGVSIVTAPRWSNCCISCSVIIIISFHDVMSAYISVFFKSYAYLPSLCRRKRFVSFDEVDSDPLDGHCRTVQEHWLDADADGYSARFVADQRDAMHYAPESLIVIYRVVLDASIIP